jgi:hypothetical protein
MQTYTNSSAVPLAVAVYLATDHYDYIPNTISATALLKPIRARVLASRVPADMGMIDIMSMSKSRIGTSIHDGFEKAWVGGHYKESMLKLGYPQSVIDRIVVNPEGPLPPKAIPVYLEKRSFRDHMGYRIGGKFDLVAEGRVADVKSTGTYTWTNETKTEDYQLQGSIYRWLNPEIIVDDLMAVYFFFTDWAAYRLKSEKNYPPQPVMQQLIPLLSLQDTEDFISQRLQLFDQHKTSHEQDLPLCTDKELWRKEAVYKYYKSGKIGPRSTKNFPTAREAHEQLHKDKGVGIVVEVPGEVVACKYCPAFPLCTQKDRLIADGSLKLETA